MAKQTQMLKGVLEGCILEIVSQEESYGYSICQQLIQAGFSHINEGIVYPILIRLEKKGWLQAEMRPSPYGPKRKYYRLTEMGQEERSEFILNWNKTKGRVDQILEGRISGENA
ncbi:PadR family transcriptional regulator [Gottschalkiaceae bacterium SANA]|nr:PadR family transcriptional regulator [Gottschalkiaceae bacterium SANA]